ncbi:MAG: putative glyoxalase superfamily protein PhnB [Shewanella sp.]|jgi:uncharacterized glyoxalase superfamily protein PhnB
MANLKRLRLLNVIPNAHRFSWKTRSAIYNRAVAAGPNIPQEIKPFEFGGKTFIFEDTESHIWIITSHAPWKVTWKVTW